MIADRNKCLRRPLMFLRAYTHLLILKCLPLFLLCQSIFCHYVYLYMSMSFIQSLPCSPPSTSFTTVLPPDVRRADRITPTRSCSYDRRFISASLRSNPPSHPLPHPTSTLRPPVRAKDRLSNWTSPYALASRDLLQSKLPAALVEISNSVALDGLASSTRTSYAAGLLRFIQFCDNWQIPEADRMPASADLLAAFASSFVGLYSSKTINLWLSGLRSWHIINCAPWSGDNEHMHLICRAAD
jgi:hypothetical protein